MKLEGIEELKELEELEMLLDIIKRYQTKTGKEDSYSMSIQTPDEFMNQW